MPCMKSPAQDPVLGFEPGPSTPVQSLWLEPFHWPCPLYTAPAGCPLVAEGSRVAKDPQRREQSLCVRKQE